MRVIWHDYEACAADPKSDLCGSFGEIMVDVVNRFDDRWSAYFNTDTVIGVYDTRKQAKREVERYCFQHSIGARKDSRTKTLIKIEEACMLYANEPRLGLSIIQDLVEAELDGKR